jgi:hypothetical protein
MGIGDGELRIGDGAWGMGHGQAHWCQVNVKPIVRQGMNSLSQSESPRYED